MKLLSFFALRSNFGVIFANRIMYKNCKYMKQKINKGVWCTLHNERVSRDLCKECSAENRYSSAMLCKTLQKRSVINKKIAKLEKNRVSILTNDLTRCIVCGNKKDHLHEVFPGKNRINSMKEHMVLPLCIYHHIQIHNDSQMALYWKRLCQKIFEKSHTREEFINIFGRSYLDE